MDDSSGRRRAVAGLFDQLAPGYDQGTVPWFRPIAARLVDLVAPTAGGSALDIGAGRGAATFPLCDRVGPEGRVTAVDLSPVMVEHLAADARRRGLTWLRTMVGEARADLLPDAPYDVVTASLVLFFDPDPEATLREWLRLVRRGGRLGLSTFGPVDAAWQAADAAVLAHAPAGQLDPRTSGTRGPFASAASLAALVESCGGVDVTCHDEALEVVLPDAEAWRAWTMTLGMRQLWAAVPAAALPDVLEQVAGALEAARGDDGLLHLTQTVRYTTAGSTR